MNPLIPQSDPQIIDSVNQHKLAESGQSLLNNFLQSKPQELDLLPGPASEIQRHQSDGLCMLNQTHTSQEPGFLTDEERKASFFSSSSFDYDSEYYFDSTKPLPFNPDDISPLSLTSFSTYGGVEKDEFFSMDEEEEEDGDAKPTAKERWKKALLKIKTVRSFGGTIGEKEYELPPEIEAKRLVAREELLSSEKEYYSRLSILVNCFMNPLIKYIDNMLAKTNSRGSIRNFSFATREADSGGLIPPEITAKTAKEVRAVFGNIVQIRDLTKHLLGDLEVVIADPRAKIGPVFVKLAPFLRMYLIYYQSFNAARSALDKLRSSLWCDVFISACEAQPCCKGRGIKDFLIEPVQRVPRYELLIKEVIRYTPPSHPNNIELLRALRQVKEVADGMHIDMGSGDSRLKVASLSIAWVGVNFTAPHRMFLKEGALVKTDRHGIKRKNYFLLFNDLMCYGDKIDESKLFMRRRTQSGGEGAETGSDGDRYKLRFKAPLLECLVIDDTMVYGKHGALRLWDKTPYAVAMMNYAANKGGDAGRQAIMDKLQKETDNEEAAQAWDLLNSCGAGLDRVLKCQLSDNSFLIQVKDKTLFLTAASVQERKEWVTAFADAIRNSLEEEKQLRNGQRRVSTIATKIEDNHSQVVANESLFNRLSAGHRSFKTMIRRSSTSNM